MLQTKRKRKASILFKSQGLKPKTKKNNTITKKPDTEISAASGAKRSRRREMNRISAKRSRLRKKLYLEELASTNTLLMSENRELSASLEKLRETHQSLQACIVICRFKL